MRWSLVLWPLLLAVCSPGSTAAATADWEWQLPRGFPLPAVPADNPMSQPKVELGRRLFGDTRLSVTGNYSCASCHIPDRAYTDGRALAQGAQGAALRRNAMTLTNVAYSAAYEWASDRVGTLEQQMLTPLLNDHPLEIGLAGRETQVLAELAADPGYASAFGAAFPQDSQPLMLVNLVRAIAAFERTLIAGRSAFDRYVFDDERDAMTPSARRGMALFYSERARCGQCHSGLNFQGPLRSAADPQALPVFANTGLYDVDGHGGYPQSDRGLIEVTRRAQDNGRFRVPTLRNVALTAPYMHDGSIATLAEVIEHYNRGGRARPAAAARLTDPLIRPLRLSQREKADLQAFLHSLTDQGFPPSDQISRP
ncbi:MAG TPA: MbnH family di-heme enzyme [Steroidobacteraceae bacterium]|nr:MbnH family di-heme enzyme [Steroidobacteraceae bacterium]